MSVRIFLSAVSSEFRSYRDQLRTDLTRHNVDVKVQEDFKDYGGVTLDKLDLYIYTCNAVVHLVGEMSGAEAKPASVEAIRIRVPDLAEKLPPLRLLQTGAGISYTQWEAWLALYHGKLLLIAQADSSAPRGPDYAPTDASRAAQQAHLARLRRIERYPGCAFTSTDNLAKHIFGSAILDLLAKEHGVEAAPLRAILQRLGEIGVPDREISARLDAAANELIELRAQLRRLTNERPELAPIRAQALALIDRGDLDGARAALSRGREAARELRQGASRNEAEFLADEARIDHLQLAYRAAAEKYSQAAALVAPVDREGEWRFITQEAGELQHHGAEFGDNEALVQAITTHRRALALAPQATTPLEWAMTQNNLGVALSVLGERESDTARLEEAVAAHRAALLELTRERLPLDWAISRGSLGRALLRLGERESDTARLEEAVAAFREALEECPRNRMPLEWAGIQNNLALALRWLGERESDTARLQEAIAAYRAALEETPRERLPQGWAGTQNNLGIILLSLGERESDKARLEEAVAAFRAALEENTRERIPLEWAGTQNNLGLALCGLGERQSDTARLKEAVAAFRAALLERTRERVPLQWAATQNNLGMALSVLGERESDTARLEEAVAAYRAALEEYTRDRVPLDWGMTQNNLGTTLRTLGGWERDTARLKEALAAFRAALLERTRERVPLHGP